MELVEFQFSDELNAFLPLDKRHVAFSLSLDGQPLIKDLIEALGVPLSKVGLVLANAVRVDLSYLVQDGDHITVHP